MSRFIERMFSSAEPNPDVIGRFQLEAQDIDAKRLARNATKLEAAKNYIAARGITVRPICRTLREK